MKKLFVQLAALGGIVVFSQIPLFVDQYGFRLEGHLAECRQMVENYKKSAKDGGKSLGEYVEKFISSEDDDFKREGALMQGLIKRHEMLEEASLALQQASGVVRPFVFVRHADEQVVTDAWHGYKPGVSFTVEGLVWALCGGVIGVLFVYSIRGLFSKKSPPSTPSSS
jgi:hypothetical protein